MTAKEKAKDLVDNYIIKHISHYGSTDFDLMKEFALMAVDEILKNEKIELPFNKRSQIYFSDVDYWREVKTELNKL